MLTASRKISDFTPGAIGPRITAGVCVDDQGESMDEKRKILVFGASYGSLLAAKLLGAGHTVTLVCRPATARLINAEGIRVRIPLPSGGEVVEVDSRRLPGKLSASTPSRIDF